MIRTQSSGGKSILLLASTLGARCERGSAPLLTQTRRDGAFALMASGDSKAMD